MVAIALLTSLVTLASTVYAGPAAVPTAAPTVPAHLYRERLSKRNPGGNWNGAAITGLTGVRTVSAQVTVPTPSNPKGGPDGTKYSGSAWVGIDGDETKSPMWQAGITWNIESGVQTFSGWWDWCSPEYCGATSFSGFEMSAGDIISMEVQGHAHHGYARLENTCTGQVVNTTQQNKPGPLVFGTTAEWIVEDFEENGQVPFASFNPVAFDDCTYNGGNTIDAASFFGSTEQPDGKTVTFATQTDSNSFIVTYNGTSY